jgi:hypothetical protein
LNSIISIEFHATETYLSLDLIKAKSSLTNLPEVEKEHVLLQINLSSIIVCGKEQEQDDENKVYRHYVSLIQSFHNIQKLPRVY